MASFLALSSWLRACWWVQVGHTAYNGVTRQIPGTQSLDTRNGNPIPSEADEPLWMKMSTAVRKCLR